MTSKWALWRLKSPASSLFTQPFIRAQFKENIKVPCHWPFWPVAGEFPAQTATKAENVSIWWSHYVSTCVVCGIDFNGQYVIPDLMESKHLVTQVIVISSVLTISPKRDRECPLWVYSHILEQHLLFARSMYHDKSTVLHGGSTALQWRHNGRDGVSNHQPHDCLLSRLFRQRSKKSSKLCVTGLLCEGNSPVTGEFPTQMASNAENVSIWWRHHGTSIIIAEYMYICGVIEEGMLAFLPPKAGSI